MKKHGRAAALIGALIFLCGIVAWEWYAHIGAPGTAAPAPVQAIGSSPLPSPTPQRPAAPSPTPTAKPGPVVYVPVPQGSPSPAPVSPAPSGAPSAAGTPTPIEAPEATPQAQPVPVVTLGPSAALPGIVRENSNARPRILALSLSTPVARGGDVVSGFVETSSNVASVEARIAGYSSTMKKVGVGKFVLTYRVPRLPFFLHRTYDILVIARNTRGDSVSSSVPITIR